MTSPRPGEVRGSAVHEGRADGVSVGVRELVIADLRAMCEGRSIGPGRLALRVLIHQRYRAAIRWRLAQRCMQARITKPLGLWLTSRTLSTSGAELQPTANIGAGVVLKHTTGLVVGGEVVAGTHLTLHQNVTVGDRRPYCGQPILGDEVVIGAGACVLGPIRVGDGAVIAANSVVLDSVPAGAVVAGSPARVIKPPLNSAQAHQGASRG